MNLDFHTGETSFDSYLVHSLYVRNPISPPPKASCLDERYLCVHKSAFLFISHDVFWDLFTVKHDLKYWHRGSLGLKLLVHMSHTDCKQFLPEMVR